MRSLHSRVADRGRKPDESWGELADDLWSLADKAFPDLDEMRLRRNYQLTVTLLC